MSQIDQSMLTTALPEKLVHWLENHINENCRILPVPGDAGMRRYYRVLTRTTSYICMVDSDTTQLKQYIHCATQLAKHLIRVPTLYHMDLQQGFLLQQDLGDCMLSDTLSRDQVTTSYARCIDQIIRLQQLPHSEWPVYDQTCLVREAMLPVEWFFSTHCKQPLTADESQIFTDFVHALSTRIQQQPYQLVHRDFHSRNIMIHAGEIGLIDFQDAIWGPITYDVASLLRDYYQPWSNEVVEQGMHYYYHASRESNIHRLTLTAFKQAFYETSLQRHLKVLGIFCRLAYRDGKIHFLDYLPTVYTYLTQTAEHVASAEAIMAIITSRIGTRL